MQPLKKELNIINDFIFNLEEILIKEKNKGGRTEDFKETILGYHILGQPNEMSTSLARPSCVHLLETIKNFDNKFNITFIKINQSSFLNGNTLSFKLINSKFVKQAYLENKFIQNKPFKLSFQDNTIHLIEEIEIKLEDLTDEELEKLYIDVEHSYVHIVQFINNFYSF
jgi:hypothetical protein